MLEKGLEDSGEGRGGRFRDDIGAEVAAKPEGTRAGAALRGRGC